MASQMRKRFDFGLLLVGLLIAAGSACGGGSDPDEDTTVTLSSGDIGFKVEFLGADPVSGDIRRGGQLESTPVGSSWWGFELRIEHESDDSVQSARTPDVGIACNDESASTASTFDDPGFIVGQAPYATGMLENGASNTGVVPLLVPDNANNCRFVVRMDPLHDPDPPEVAEFPVAAP